MSGFGAFSPEAYQQLQDAYAAQLLAADEAEQNGVEIDGEKLGVETLAVPSPWLEKTGLWQYPSGRGDYLDTKQTQEDLLAALQDDEDDETSASDELSDEELDQLINELLDGEEEGDESSAFDELSDEELDQLINELLDELDEDEVEEEEKTVEEITAEIETLKAELAELTSETDQQEEEEDSE